MIIACCAERVQDVRWEPNPGLPYSRVARYPLSYAASSSLNYAAPSLSYASPYLSYASPSFSYAAPFSFLVTLYLKTTKQIYCLMRFPTETITGGN